MYKSTMIISGKGKEPESEMVKVFNESIVKVIDSLIKVWEKEIGNGIKNLEIKSFEGKENINLRRSLGLGCITTFMSVILSHVYKNTSNKNKEAFCKDMKEKFNTIIDRVCKEADAH